VLESLATKVGLDATRAALVAAHAVSGDAVPSKRLSTLAALAHRLERGIRLM
jgi:hypothetical protein